MSTLEEKRRLRAAFMHSLYEATNGDQLKIEDSGRLARSVGVPDDEIRSLVQYLEGEFLIKVGWTMGGPPHVQIEHAGVAEVEAALQEPDEPTDHFAAINTINIHGNVSGAQFALAGGDISQIRVFHGSQTGEVRQLVSRYRDALPELDIGVQPVAAAQLDQVDAEIAKVEPHPAVVSGLLSSLKSFAENAIATAGAGTGTLALAQLVANWPF